MNAGKADPGRNPENDPAVKTVRKERETETAEGAQDQGAE